MRQDNFVETALELGAIEARLVGHQFGKATFERPIDADAFVDLCEPLWSVDKARRLGHNVIIKFWKFKPND